MEGCTRKRPGFEFERISNRSVCPSTLSPGPTERPVALGTETGELFGMIVIVLMAEKAGASFTGFTSSEKVSVTLSAPSLTLSVTGIPLEKKLAAGRILAVRALPLPRMVTVAFSAEPVTERRETGVFGSAMVKLTSSTPSSFTT